MKSDTVDSAQYRVDLYRLIAILSDGAFHSGESLGEAIGVTRSAVWKQLQKLGPMGLSVESTRGLGYRLVQRRSLLQPDKILSLLSAPAKNALTELVCFPELPSTNQFLLEQDRRQGVVCLAEWQTLGRGRRGRVWVSPYAANLYLSVRWHFDRGVSELEGLSLAVGVILAEVLCSLGLTCVQLKWPNDLICRGAKLGGILIEVGGDLTGECAAVIGIGLNVNMEDAASNLSIGQEWTDLWQLGLQIDRNLLCVTLLNSLLPSLQSFQKDGFAAYQSRWMRCGAYLNQAVKLSSPSGERSGIFRGVDVHGALLLDVGGEVVAINGGEISLRSVNAL